MNVLVTGGLGYIGSHTCIALIKANITPIILDDLSNSSEKVLQQLQVITGKSLKFYQGDIGDSTLVESILLSHEIKAVFHFAALKAVGESTEQPIRYYQNNVSKTLTLIETMNVANVHQMIFSSSATVYGEPQYLPIDESHPISATNPYGWSKVMVEQILKDQCAANELWLSIPLRYFNPVGADKSGLIGESPKGVPNNLMPFIAQTAVGKRDKVFIFGDDYETKDGTGVRDYIHINDLAKGHVDAFITHKSDVGFKPYNLGTGQGYSVLDMLKAFEIASDITIPHEIVARRAGDIACNFADASLAEQVLGWKATHTLNDMTQDTWRWQTQYPQGLE